MALRLALPCTAVLALLVIGASAVLAAGPNRGVASVIIWSQDSGREPGSPVAGAYAVQQRGYFSITAQLHTRGLTPGHRYTAWWVIYNHPAACVGGCGMDDVTRALAGDNPAGIGVHYGGSLVVQANGRLDIGTRILENSVTGCQTVAPYAALCNPLLDAAIAEATVFLLDNGPASGGPAVLATGAFADGCRIYARLAVPAVTYGATGFDCFSPQSVHLP